MPTFIAKPHVHAPQAPSLLMGMVLMLAIGVLLNLIAFPATSEAPYPVRNVVVGGALVLVMMAITVTSLISPKIKLKQVWKYVGGLNAAYMLGLLMAWILTG